MQIVQATFAVFHQFELAHQLYRRNHLRKIYSTWPWARLKREGLPRSVVGTFPLVHTADYLLGRYFRPPLARKVKWWVSTTFDEWTLRVIPECDALIALSGAALLTGALVQRRGGKFICDRGSSHHRFQDAIIAEEHDRWGLPRHLEADGVIERDEAIYALADAITVPSSFSARTFVQMGVPAAKLHIIPYGVRLEHFRRADGDGPPDIRRRFEAIFAGQVSLRKGIPYLLEAFAQVRHPNKRLRIVGSAAPAFREFLTRFPLDSVEFLGSIPQPELARIMGASHVLVLPSIEDGFGLVMNQAMACGCPVIASSNTGGEDLFTDGAQGFVVPARDPAALAARMQRLIDEPDLQRRFSEAAVGLIHNFGGWEQYGERWESLLYRLTGIPRPTA